MRWGLGVAGGLCALVGGFFWYDLRRIGKNVHALRTDVSTLILNLEAEMRRNHREVEGQVNAVRIEVAELKGAQNEAKGWREMVLQLIRAVLPEAP